MTQAVKFYGGPLHGMCQVIKLGTHRIDAADYRRWETNRYYHDSRCPPFPVADTFKRVSYGVEKFVERRGNMHRILFVAILEGTKLLPSEEYELRHDMAKVKWQPVRLPHFLTEFERWYNVKMYEFTGRPEFIQEEFRQT